MSVATKTNERVEFDPSTGSTVDVGIDPEEASVADATRVMKEAVHVAVMTPMGDPFDPGCIWGAPVLFWGLPSTAKTKKAEQAFVECMLPWAVINPGQRMPEDFSGVLMNGPNGITIETMLGAVRRLNPLGRGVIILDEINHALRATEGAMHGFVQDRMAGDVPLAPGIRMIATANPSKYSTNGYQLSAPSANRWIHLQVKCPPYREFLNHLISEGAKPKFSAAAAEDTVRANWSSAYSFTKGLVSGYMDFRGGLTLHREPEPDHPQSGLCWASPRTWEMGIRAYATAKALGYSDAIAHLMLEGAVSPDVAFDLLTWQRTAGIPTPEHVLTHGYTPDNRRLDIAFAVLTSVTQYIITQPDREIALQAAMGGWRLFDSYLRAGMGDFIVVGAHSLVNKNLTYSDDPRLAEIAGPILRWMGKNGLVDHV